MEMRPENCSRGLESLQLAQNWVHIALEICFCAGAESSFELALDSIDRRVTEGWRRILWARQSSISSIEVMEHARWAILSGTLTSAVDIVDSHLG